MNLRKMSLTNSVLVLALSFLSLQSQAAKNFVFCAEGSPSSFNPQTAADGSTFNATKQIYSTLSEFKHGSTEVEPGLAESWTISKDQLTYTFKLRKGVSFHPQKDFTPTREFNADDVLFSFNRVLDKNHPYNKIGGGLYDYFDSMEMSKLVKEVKKIDDHTVAFVLTKKQAPFIANMSMDFASILSAEYADYLTKNKKQDLIEIQPVGTGPFVFSSYQKDTQIRYKAFDKYFKGKPAIENLIFSITPDPTVRFQKLKAGECHLISEPAPQDLKAMKDNKSIKLMDKEGVNVGYLAMNVDKGPLGKKLVRQAINQALNKKSYIEAIYLNNASIATNPIPPSLWGYNTAVKDYEYNPEKAKELLKQAGYPNGFETDMWTLPVSRPYNPSGKKMGEMMQADLAKVGIKVKLLTFDWPTYLDKSKKNEHNLIQFGWTGDNGDPDNFLNVLLSCGAIKAGSNYAHWCDKNFEKLILEAQTTSDVKKRTELYKQAQVIFKQEAPWVTLAHARVYRAMSPKVKGYLIHPFGTENFEKVDLD